MRLLKGKSDQELIQMYVGGQESGLEALLNRYKSKIYTSIYMKVKDEYLAEDIFQETFIKIINTLKSGKYNEEGKFLPWAIRIAHNMIVDFFRKAKRAPNIVNADGFDIFEVLEFSDESAESKMLKQQVDVDLKKMIQKLPDDQKEVLIMRHFCDMSFKDIAEITEVSINTALGRMRYALSNLRKMIEGTDLTLQMGYL
ncbi:MULTISPECIES: RNA polymerase sigma factor [Sphingobacterium]|jgi:RNA polymerase sigma-70 factor (ECF subfamily)|uniref:RNA polymerase sigma-70 factor (ECF subfamily) n=3 Tax=Sphingobacterium TaxID=28453 RepID=A0A420G350_9SPHI|nr:MULTISPECIES: sigma-70 family RNA polymerase sigma factor [Sphingobacterium]APU95898.1 RNA polymerase subunit sigma-24 [Sphingobacterium sp. B29]MBB1645840.1 RNA polymerase subunit sigma-24 [Sphingobacterium sp. UME9]MCS4166922.1 RNA polymerase sigma-70 factor (ECF subfamily) [Sphingobacterium sp. BIGb0116]QMV69162.1 sigma-70 family RNA polymerase sigma factor [Sphingobacterium paramultivorum]QQT31508.1 sigma-70 family RNA polymerase sigma factor [Sphingobacterium multivorum]